MKVSRANIVIRHLRRSIRAHQPEKSEACSATGRNIDFEKLISQEFYSAFYSRTGRTHIYHLESFIRAFVMQKNLEFHLIFADLFFEM